jgi:hypothetical protein
VIKKNSLAELIDEVNQMLEKGWLPLGGMSAKEGMNQDHFFQAMTRNLSREPEKDPGAEYRSSTP